MLPRIIIERNIHYIKSKSESSYDIANRVNN